MNETPTPVEVTITARDAQNNTASHSFEYTPRKAGVEEAVDDLIHGWIGQIDQRMRDVQSGD